MALQTKTFSGIASNGNHKFTLTVKEESTNQWNYSYVTYSLSISPVKTGYDWVYNSLVPVEYTVNVGGHTYSSNIMTYDGKSTYMLMLAEERPIEHNTDGTKTINCSFTVTSNYSYSYLPGSCSVSGTMKLTDIPRGAELLSTKKFNDEQNPTVTLNNPAGTYTTTLEIGIGAQEAGTTVEIPFRAITDKTATSYTFNLTQAERETIRNTYLKAKKVATVYVKLRSVVNGKTYLSTLPVQVEITNAKPTVAATIKETNATIKALTGSETKTIKGFNNLEVSITATPKKGASITLYSVRNGDELKNGSVTTFSNVSSPTFTIKAVDDREIIGEAEASIEMVDYFKPTINLEASAELIGETTARITLNISGKIFRDSFGVVNNSFAFFYACKVNGGSYQDWIGIDPSEVTLGTNTYVATTSFDIDYKDSYVIKAKVIDYVTMPTGVISKETPIQIIPVFDWSNEDFNFNVPISIEGNPLLDYVIDQGTSNSWVYRKWKSGIMECWRRLQITANVSTAWGSLYTSGALATTNLTYPFAFVETPILNVSLTAFGSGAFAMAPGGSSYTSYSQTGPIEIARGTSLSSGSYLINYYAIGRWK